MTTIPSTTPDEHVQPAADTAALSGDLPAQSHGIDVGSDAPMLRESEERFRNAFDYAPIGMALVAPDGRWLQVNRSLCELVGYGESELLRGTFQDITHPDDLDADMAFVRRMLAGELRTYKMEKRYFHKSGDIVWVMLCVSLVRDARGEPLTFLSQIQDITAQKTAEAALARERELLATVVGSSGEGIVAWDRELRYTVWNGAMEQHTGLSADEVLGRNAFELFPSMQGESRGAAHHAALRGESEQLSGIARRSEALGRDGWTDETFSPLRDASGAVVGGICLVRDVTERRLAEDALRESERRFREILGTVRSVAVCLDVDGHITYANDALLELTGWTRDDVLGQSWLELFVPRGGTGADVLHASIASGEIASHVESEILTVNGERRLISWDSTVLRGADDIVTGMASLGRDVTEQRESDAASARLSAILDAMPDAVAIATPAGEVPYLNDAARRLLGLAPTDEHAPSSIRFALLPRPQIGALGPALARDPELGGPMRHALREGMWTGETICEAIDGREIPVHQTLLTHRNAQGHVDYFSTILRDITERRRIEEELRALSLVDDLTGLFNRRGFLAMAAQQLKLAERSPRTSLLFYLDLNHFKVVNDTWGHAAGDLALERAAAVLRVTFRETDVLARMGGDEFIALALNCGDTADYIVSRLHANLADENARLAGEGHRFTISLAEGRALFDPQSPRSLEELMAISDVALYEAKRNRR